MTYRTHLETIQPILQQYRYLKSIESLFELDQWTFLPTQGTEYRQQMSAYVGSQKASLFRSYDAKKAAEYFQAVPMDDIESYIEQGQIKLFLHQYALTVHTPSAMINQYNLLRGDTMYAWKQAREKKNFLIFAPYLEQVFSLKKQIAQAINPQLPPFHVLVRCVDQGLDADIVSREFDALKSGIVPLLNRIVQSGEQIDDALLHSSQDISAMTQFAQKIVQKVGYDATKNCFNHQVIHGFTSFMGPRDARISTQKSGKNHLLYTCLHELGHAMFASGGSQQVNDAHLWGGVEGGFHEACARFYENIVGKSPEFVQWYYPQLQREFSQYAPISVEEYYRTLHRVAPTLKRTEADEVTYSLHAILRFELERDYFNGSLEVADMAEAWNEKYQNYLGVRPPDDTQGILQDMHWAGDYIGYFQSYALGNIYDGQILQAIENDLPHFRTNLLQGDLTEINDWMYRNIWQYGCCYTGSELAHRLTGSSLDAKPFLDYLTKKYATIYPLN